MDSFFAEMENERREEKRVERERAILMSFEAAEGGMENSKHVCQPGWYRNNGSCLQQCASGTYAARNDNGSGVFCIACHYSCLSCKGPSDTDCVACHVDSIFTWDDGRPLCVLSSLSWRMHSTGWFYRMTVAFFVNLCLMTIVVIYLVSSWYIRKRKSAHKYSKVSYGNGEVHADTEQLQGNTCVSDSE